MIQRMSVKFFGLWQVSWLIIALILVSPICWPSINIYDWIISSIIWFFQFSAGQMGSRLMRHPSFRVKHHMNQRMLFKWNIRLMKKAVCLLYLSNWAESQVTVQYANQQTWSGRMIQWKNRIDSWGSSVVSD